MPELSIVQKINSSVKAKFLENFCELTDKTVLLAVSGGADSMVMLQSVFLLSKELKFNVAVVTVNHNIRSVVESKNDVTLVKTTCDKLGVPCFIKEFPENFLLNQAKTRQKGIEEAARFYRYSAFHEVKEQIGAALVCLAHNKNDQLETLIMRFLQGSLVQSGIQTKRDFYFRPLIETTRAEIEQYAKELNIPFCVDSTNLDNSYYRNKIRHQIIPLLDSIVPGWQTSVINGAKKANALQELLNELSNQIEWNINSSDEAFINYDNFKNLQAPVKINLLYKGLSLINQEQIRFPYKLIEDFCNNFTTVYSKSIVITLENNKIYIRKNCKNRESGFLVFVQNEGVYELDFGTVAVKSNEQNSFNAILQIQDENIQFISPDFSLPIVIRNKQASDKIQTKTKQCKEISKIFSEWKVSSADKYYIPIFENDSICGIWGEPFGYENYFVRNKD